MTLTEQEVREKGAPAPAYRPVVALVGNPRSGSRTAAVARAVQARAGQVTGAASGAVVDLAAGPADDEDVDAVLSAGTLVVASPTYKGTFTGLLKVFLDALPPQALAGVVAVPVMTAASPEHRHAAESYLRPLLLELGATVPVPGVSVLESELDDLDARLDGWARESASLLSLAAGGGR